MKRLSRSALACRAAASSIVASASSAISGETSSEQKPSTPAVRSWTPLKRSVASRRSASASSKKIRSVGSRADPLLGNGAGAELGDLLVVGVAAGDRLVEDRRVGGEAGDRELLDVAAQGAVGQHRAGDVVEPEALAQVVQLRGRLHAEQLLCGFGHLVGGEAELGLNVFQRRRGAEGVHPDLDAVRSNVAIPAQRRGLLDRDPRGDARRQDLVAVGLVLAVEELPAGQADHTRADALAAQLLVGGERQRDLAAGGDQDHLGVAALGVGEHVAAAAQALGRGVLGAVEDRHVLAGEDQGDRLVAAVDRHPPGLGDLVGVGGADHVEAGDRPQRGELLDRLVGRAVLAEADRVVGEDVDHRQLHQRREADRRPGVVGEGEVGRPERPQLGEREAVADRRRLVLADAEVELAAVVGAGLEVLGAVEVEPHRGRVGEVGGAGEQPGQARADRVLDLLRGLAGGDPLLVGVEAGDRRRPSPRAARASAAPRSRRRGPAFSLA